VRFEDEDEDLEEDFLGLEEGGIFGVLVERDRLMFKKFWY